MSDAASTGRPEPDPRGEILVTPGAFADRDGWHTRVAELRRDNPVALVELDGWPRFWAVTRHADVLEVSRRADVFHNTTRSAPGPDVQYDVLDAIGIKPSSLVHIHGDVHQKHRQVTNDWFKPAAVRRLQPAIEAIAAEFADRMADLDGNCDLAADIIVPFTLRVIMKIYGVPESDEALMLELTQGLFGAADPEYLGDFSDPLTLITDTVARFQTYFDAITEDRRAKPTADLATVIANGVVDGLPLGDNERLWYFIIVATAGHDTTSYALSGGFEQLLRHPDQLAAVQQNPDLAGAAAEEMIRWTSPVRSFMRWAFEDHVLGGTRISKGDAVLTSYPAANRDPDVFERPMHFDIFRPDADRLLSFGLGVHYCLGSQVARREVRTLLSAILDRVASIELAAEPAWAESHFVSGVKHLPVSYTMR